MAKPTRQELDRIIVGNQLAIMRALAAIAGPVHQRDLEFRVHDVKDWWRRHYNEEVGFSSILGDKPPSNS
jgi:hypothetical protein